MKAVLETNNSLVLSRIMAARSTLADRLDGTAIVDDEEFVEIENALRSLEALERERCSDGHEPSAA